MNRRRDVLERLGTLKEIGSIMNTLKNISYMETRKIMRLLSSQQQVVGNIEAAAEDFLHFYPTFHKTETQEVNVYFLIGSERGFCGDFNRSLLREFERIVPDERRQQAQIIVIGHKLCVEVGGHYKDAIHLAGPGIGDEVHGRLAHVIDELRNLHARRGSYSLTLLHHEDGHGVKAISLLPPFKRMPEEKKSSFVFPPRLMLSPSDFFAEIVRHYVFATLHVAFFTSLMAEHLQRVKHLEGATRRLEEQSAELAQKRNMLRQEEITEEIEEIMLGTIT